MCKNVNFTRRALPFSSFPSFPDSRRITSARAASRGSSKKKNEDRSYVVEKGVRSKIGFSSSGGFLARRDTTDGECMRGVRGKNCKENPTE